MQIEPLKPWAWPNIHPWPPGDRTVVHSHVSFDGGKTFVARNHLGEHLPDIRLSLVVAQPSPKPEPKSGKR